MFICNLTGYEFHINDGEKHREGGTVFDTNSRIRALVYVLLKTVF